MRNLSDFQKTKDYLICVDSDGCAMDTMDIKHIRCFGPCMVQEWQLDRWQDEILFRWNEVNLYTMTRGINRFKGLAAALTEVNDRFCPIDGVEKLTYWAEHSDELSNDALQREIAAQPDQVIFQKALSWSNAVNASIRELPVVAISVNAPTMLSDIPMVRTYINAYDSKPSTLDALVDNLVTGADSFRGSDPIDSFCGLWDTRI